MNCNNRFRIPCAVVNTGAVKELSREALVMLLVDCFAIDHKLGDGQNPPPMALMLSLTGFTPVEMDAAQKEVLEVMLRLNTNESKQPSEILDDMFKAALEKENISPAIRTVIESLQRDMEALQNTPEME